MSYKYFSPPTGAYHVKYNQCDAKEKMTHFVPNGSSPEKDPRFDYSKKDTLLWLPHARELESLKVQNHVCTALCTKCIKKDGLGSVMGSIEHSQSPLRNQSKET